MKTALVTGGNGFIGSALIRRLIQSGYIVHATTNKSRAVLDSLLPSSRIHNLNGPPSLATELVRDLTPGVIFHLAARSSEPKTLEEKIDTLEANLQLGIALLHGAESCPLVPSFLNAGTYWQFSDPTFEVPNSFYAASKQAFHNFLLQFRRNSRSRALTLVLYDTIGVGDTRPKLWNQLAHALPGSTFALSGGAQEIALVDVKDITNGFIHAAELLDSPPHSPTQALYTLSSQNIYTLYDFLESAKKRGILDLEFGWNRFEYPQSQIFKLWRGQQLPGWQPTIDVFQTLAEMVKVNVSSSIL